MPHFVVMPVRHYYFYFNQYKTIYYTNFLSLSGNLLVRETFLGLGAETTLPISGISLS